MTLPFPGPDFGLPPLPPGQARHQRPSSGADAARKHGRRFTSFSLIGAAVFGLGTGFQWALIRAGAGADLSYAGQAVFSIELSFVLNRWLTWRSRTVRLVPAAVKWNTQKLALTVPNFLGYALLVLLGLNWLLANIAITAVFTVINYVGADVWSFHHSRRGRKREWAWLPGSRSAGRDLLADDIPVRAHPASNGVRQWVPSVSVIVPCFRNPGTIRATVLSLLGQDYPALEEVILVGSTGDTTWRALADVTDPRLIIIEQEPVPGKRDPAIKRDKGIRKSSSEVLALADSDIVMDPDWLSRGVGLLDQQGRDGAVCGGMRSIHDTYWGRFVDRNVIAAKTPRVPRSYLVTAENFGRRGRKPPITANVIMARSVYDPCPIDVNWMFGYEDYEWFWRLARAGHPILYAAGLDGAHHHRRTFRALIQEYLRSADGCARFIRAHPDSPLARKRLRQATLLPVLAVAGLVAVGIIAVHRDGPLALAAAAGILALTLMIREARRSRSPVAALTYPFAGLVLGAFFTFGLAHRLAFPATPASAPDGSAPRRRHSARVRLTAGLAFAGCLAGGAALRFWQLAGKPGWQYDEGVYTLVARNLLQQGTLNEHITYHAPWTPFLFQPVWYFLLLSRWFAITGPAIYHARILGVICALGTLTALFRLLWRIHGPRMALAVSVPIIFDGWLLYIQRISYIENALLLLVALGMLCYQRALDRPSLLRFLLAGAVLGGAACFKFTGGYVLVVVLLCWLILRRAHGGHLVLCAVALAVIAADQALMVHWFDAGGHDWYIQENLIQVERVLGLRRSGGTLTSPLKALHLLAAQYRVFLPSLLIALGSVLIAVRRLWACLRARSWARLRPNALLFSWMAGGVIVFGLSSLRFPQYFALILVPMYCYLWTELWQWDRRAWLKAATAGTAVAAGLASFWFRVPAQSDNVFAQVQTYAAGHIPARSVVLTEETIGDLISQPYCRVEVAAGCLGRASYAITWVTYLQSSLKLGDPAFHRMMRGARAIKSFTGFSGTATIWRLQ